MIIRQLTAQEHLHLIPLLQALWPGQERAEWLEELENSTRDPEVVFFLAWECEHAIGSTDVVNLTWRKCFAFAWVNGMRL